jgi:hypothetical protein
MKTLKWQPDAMIIKKHFYCFKIEHPIETVEFEWSNKKIKYYICFTFCWFFIIATSSVRSMMVNKIWALINPAEWSMHLLHFALLSRSQYIFTSLIADYID